jgi:competence protein ComEC
VFAGVGWAYAHTYTGGWWLLLLLPLLIISLPRHNAVTALLLVLLCFGIGWWRGSVVKQQFAVYNSLAKQQVTIVGRVTEDGVYGTRYQLTFGLDHSRVLAPYTTDLPGRVQVSGFGAPAVYRGDEIVVTGKLYPARGNNQGRISFAELQVVRHHETVIDTFRRRFAAGMQSALPEPLASFGLGLLIGQRNTLPEDVSDTLLIVGLTHIIAVSGYNLTIMVEATRRLLGRRSKFQTAAVCLLLIATFLLITGNSPSIVRASIISVLSIAAWYYGRTWNPLALLLTAGVITVLANPLYVWGNVSWYLSFLAFFGVVVIAPLIITRIYKNKEPRLVPQMLLESLCAEAMTLPHILYIFGEISTVSLLANVLVAAFVPLAMLLGVVAGLAGMLLPVLAGWFAWPARILLTYMLDAAQLISRIPHAFVEHVGFSFTMLLIWYSIIGGVIIALHYKVKAKGGIITEKNTEM